MNAVVQKHRAIVLRVCTVHTGVACVNKDPVQPYSTCCESGNRQTKGRVQCVARICLNNLPLLWLLNVVKGDISSTFTPASQPHAAQVWVFRIIPDDGTKRKALLI